jgi:negative regulator of sigma E activity
MTMHEEWTDKLSEYLDGELSEAERRAVDAHLRECAHCVEVLNDLKRVVARAQATGQSARPPHADLWAGIAERIDARHAPGAGADRRSPVGKVAAFRGRASRHFAFTLPQLAAAAALVAAVSGGIVWQIAGSPKGLRYDEPAPAIATTSEAVAQPFRAANGGDSAAPDDTTAARVETVGLADAQYDAAVADLEKALKAGRGRLDPSTVAVVEHNLQIIDQAIGQAREALAGDPANTYLSSHLVETRRRKLDLLRRATALTTDMD